MDTQADKELPEQPPPGGICYNCGHFAARHGPDGCMWPEEGGCKSTCQFFLWNGVEWPRPWLAAPDGLKEES